MSDTNDQPPADRTGSVDDRTAQLADIPLQDQSAEGGTGNSPPLCPPGRKTAPRWTSTARRELTSDGVRTTTPCASDRDSVSSVHLSPRLLRSERNCLYRLRRRHRVTRPRTSV